TDALTPLVIVAHLSGLFDLYQRKRAPGESFDYEYIVRRRRARDPERRVWVDGQPLSPATRRVAAELSLDVDVPHTRPTSEEPPGGAGPPPRPPWEGAAARRAARQQEVADRAAAAEAARQAALAHVRDLLAADPAMRPGKIAAALNAAGIPNLSSRAPNWGH